MKRTLLARRGLTAFGATFALVAGVVPGVAGLVGVAQAATLTVSPPAALNESAPFVLTVSGVSNPVLASAPAPTLSVDLVGPGGQELTVPADSSTGGVVRATIDLAPGTPGLPTGPGTYSVSVCVDPGQIGCGLADPHGDATESGSMLVVSDPPSVATVTPNQRAQGSAKVGFTFSGAHIANGATVAFLKDGVPDAAIVGVTSGTGSPAYSGGNTMTQSFTVGAGAVLGGHQVRITNTDGASSIGGVFTVNARPTAAPADFDIGKGVTDQVIHLTGTGFMPGLTVSVDGVTPFGPNDVSAVPVYIDTTHLDLKMSSDSTADNSPATGGERAVTISNPDGGSTSVTAHIVDGPDMTLASTSLTTTDGQAIGAGAGLYGTDKPDMVIDDVQYAGSTPPIVDLGTGITHGPVSLSTGSNSTPLIPTKKITILDLVVAGDAPEGDRSPTVIDPTTGAGSGCPGGTSNLACIFTVNAAPTVASASPSHRGPGASGFTVTLSGTGFEQTSTSGTLVKIGSFYTSGLLNSNSSGTSVTTGSITIPAAEPRGPKDVIVSRDSDGGAVDCFTCFSVDDFDVTSISVTGGPAVNFPPSATAGNTVLVRGLRIPIIPGNPIKLYLTHAPTVADQPDIVVSGTVSCDPSVGTCLAGEGNTFNGSVSFLNVAPGYYVPRLATADNSRSATCNCSQYVVGNQPTVTAVTPATVGKGAQNYTITLTGTGFYPGVNVKLASGVTDVTIVAGSVARDASTPTTKLSFKINVASNAATGDKSFTVINTDGFESAASKFAVTAGPTLTKVTPASAGQGATGVSVALEGTGLASGATFGFGAGVAVEAGTVTVAADGKSATLKIDVATDAANGTRDVSVANPDGGTGVMSKAFTVNLGPTVQSVSSPVLRGTASFPMKVVGANFVATPTVTISGTGVTVDANGVSFDDANNLTVKITIAANAARGARTVTVKNPDGGQFVCINCLNVVDKAAAPTPVTARSGDGQLQVNFAKAADDGGSAITSYTVTCYLSGSSPHQEVHAVSVPATAATSYTVVVKTKAADGGSGIPVTNGKAYDCDSVANTGAGPGLVAKTGPVTPAPVQRLVSIKPQQIVNSTTGRGIPGGKIGRLQSNGSTPMQFDVPFANVPAAATGAVVSIEILPSAVTYVKLYGTGTPAPSNVQVYGLPGIAKSGTAFIALGAAKALHVVVYGGPSTVVINHVAWQERLDQEGAAPSTEGGRFVPTDRVLINYRMSSGGPLPAADQLFYYDFNSSLPEVDSIAVQISTSNSRSRGSVIAYSPADGPVATGHTFTAGRAATTFVVARVSKVDTPSTTDPAGTQTNRVYFKVRGQTGMLVTMVGYWAKDNTGFAGHNVTVPLTRMLSATQARGGEISVRVPDSVPTSTTGVLVAITAWDSTASTVVRTYPDGGTIPSAYTLSYVRGDKTTNLAIVGVGANRYIKLKVYGANTKLYVDLIGFIN